MSLSGTVLEPGDAALRPMEDGVRPGRPGGAARLRWRLRLTAICLLMTAVMFVQRPGEIAPDTKLDLTVDPWGLLARALHLWDPQGFFGQVQNQGYGYLFPMGPFFGILTSAGVPPWVAQRLWWSALVMVGFLGVVRLSRLLGVRAGWPQVAAGLAYVVAPRVLSTVGPISAETLPVMVAPWVIVPLALAARGGLTARRAAMRSGVAVLLLGGINAVAVGAVLVLPALFLLTRAPGAAKRRLVAWWVLAVGMASLWWLLPLLLLSKYSPPFLDWIETAAVTTRFNGSDQALRGVDDWVAYLLTGAGPTWQAGFSLVSQEWLIAATTLVALIGLWGVARTSRRERTFLLVSCAVGMILLTVWHVGAYPWPFSEGLNGLLDGVLSPLRNIHKFDPVLRLPLSIGVGLAVGSLLAWRPDASWWRPVALSLVVAALAIAAAPAWSRSLAPDGSNLGIPDYWRGAVQWADAHRGDGRTLVLPGSSFAVFLWGRTQDDPVQALSDAPWGLRDAVPLGNAGTTRLLDAVQARLRDGRGSLGLAPELARMGVDTLLVRNDLDPSRTDLADMIGMRRALQTSPGISLVYAAGPAIPRYAATGQVVNDDLGGFPDAVEIYHVEHAAPRAALYPVSSSVSLTGAPESLLPALDSGLLTNRPAVLDSDLPAGFDPGAHLLTDGNRRQEVAFGRILDNRSPVMTPSAPFLLPRRTHDYVVSPGVPQVTAGWSGAVAGVTASSSASDPDTLRPVGAGASAAAALDGDPQTAWVSGNGTAVGSWWQVDFRRPVDVRGIEAQWGSTIAPSAAVSTVRVRTDAGETLSGVDGRLGAQPLVTPPGLTRSLRITIATVDAQTAEYPAVIRDVLLPPTVRTHAVWSVPSAATTAPDLIDLASPPGERTGCHQVDFGLQCSTRLVAVRESRPALHRLVDVGPGGRYRLTVRVQSRPGAEVDRVLDDVPAAPQATASSTWVTDPRVRAAAAVDGDPATAWIASPLDATPTLTISLPRARPITALRLVAPTSQTLSTPLQWRVEAGGRVQQVFADASGTLALARVVADRITLTLLRSVPVRSVESDTRASAPMPVGVAEVMVDGAPLTTPLPTTAPWILPCGAAPTLLVDGVSAGPEQVLASRGDALGSITVSTTPCGDDAVVTLSPGVHDLGLEATDALLPVGLTLQRVGGVGTGSVPAPVAVHVSRWDATSRTLDVPAAAGERLLVVPENANAGWQAAGPDGVPLTPVRIDGWSQGWIVPAGLVGRVSLSYAPDSVYRWSLLLGLVAAVLLVLLAFVPGRGRGTPEEIRPMGGVLGPVALLVAAALSAGIVGGLVTVIALVVALAWRGRPRGRLAAVLMVAAGGALTLLLVATPWPADWSDARLAAAGALTSLTLCAAALAALGQRGGGVGHGSGAPVDQP